MLSQKNNRNMSYIKLFAVGDISLQVKNNKHPFRNVKDILREKDILFGNLETVLSKSGNFAEKAVLLFSNPQKVKYLKDVDFDVLNIANNHILDLGMAGFHRTLTSLRENKLDFIGANDSPELKYKIQEKNGVKIGFSGYANSGCALTGNYVWVNKIEEDSIIKDIYFLKAKCDFVIISLHWGIENVFYPSPEQINLAHKFIDAGATLVLGHHTHVIQGIEQYKHGLIAYSLGNFQFNPNISTPRQITLLCFAQNLARRK